MSSMLSARCSVAGDRDFEGPPYCFLALGAKQSVSGGHDELGSSPHEAGQLLPASQQYTLQQDRIPLHKALHQSAVRPMQHPRHTK